MAKGKKNRKDVEVDENRSRDSKYKQQPTFSSDAGSDAEVKMEETKSTAKSKKDRKKKKEQELDDAQDELERLNEGKEASEDEEDKPKKGKTGKKNKKDKKKKEDSDDEANDAPVVQKSGFALLMDDDGSGGENDDFDDDDDVPKPAKKQNKKKAAKKSAFEQLADLDDDAGSDVDEVEPEKEVEEKKDKKKKAKKGNKKQDEAVDDDLDQALADLGIEQPAADDKKKKKKKKKKDDDDEDDLDKALAELRLDGGIETAETAPETESAAAKKRREKKERQKLKEKTEPIADAATAPAEPVAVAPAEKEGEGDDEGEGDKGKGKGKKKVEKEDKKAKKPGKGMLAAMQEALKKVQEDEEKRKKAEEEKIRLEEEAERQRLEQKRLIEERKALKKQREKEKKEELKKAGLYLTAKQKEQKLRAEASLAALAAQGVQVPKVGEKRGPRPGTRIRPNKKKHDTESGEAEKRPEDESADGSKESSPVDEESKSEQEVKESWEEEIKDSWEEVVAEEPPKEVEQPPKEDKKEEQPGPAKPVKAPAEEEEEESSDEEDESSSDEEDESESESEEESEEEHVDGEDKRAKAVDRISKRRAANEKSRNTEHLRAPVVCVLGHVDTGKTKILDKLRRTNVQDGEAGGITQQIGATNVPIDVIREQCKMVKNFEKETVKLPGLLIIDTPGHESFSNLRDRGSSLCDIAILVVDIMHCLEPQTIESINMLKKKKVPFVIALNKIDRIYEWKSNRHKDIQEVVKSQAHNTFLEFDKRAKEVIVAMAEQGLNASLFFENPDPRTYISMVPTSAHTGEGMGNLMALLVKLSQDMLAARLAYSQELQATVLEVKAIPGLGTTIDIVLLNGSLREGQTMVVAGTDGPIVTVIKALLTPSKMQDLRVKNTYTEHKEIQGAQGVKIAAKDLEKAIAGLNLLVANHPDEVDICKEEIQARLDAALNSIKVKDRGVFVQASTLGSLEALLEFLKTSKIPYAGVKVGPVVKRDVMKASVMLEHEVKYAVILAFDVKIERDAQDMADSLGVKVFQADIIYHLFDRFTAYQEDLRRQKREEFKHVVVFPCKLRVMPNFVFKSRDPIVAGVIVEAGIIRHGTPICVPSKEFLDIGIVTSIESNHKEVETARKGEEVCIKIDPIPGESPKMFGRHFDETDILVSKISRASIDACKDYYRDDLQKSDWQLMIELKKTFGIM